MTNNLTPERCLFCFVFINRCTNKLFISYDHDKLLTDFDYCSTERMFIILSITFLFNQNQSIIFIV